MKTFTVTLVAMIPAGMSRSLRRVYRAHLMVSGTTTALCHRHVPSTRMEKADLTETKLCQRCAKRAGLPEPVSADA